ncbi:cytochrome P450 [Hyaloscypha finlandica]|nr:cytochrome P450 [Hyaloscypha finlandica]
MLSIQSSSLLQAAVFVGITYCIVLVIRRVYFSPISHFPGPKLAIATLWYQFYYDVVLGGQYVWRVRDLHKKYGPIVRINPYELHVDDPDFLEDIFVGPGTHKRDKWEWSTKGLGVPGSTLMTNPHDLHRVRRAALNPFFSKMSVRNLQPLMDAKLDFFVERFEEFQKTGEVMTINIAFAALTNDIASEFAFGTSHDRIRHPNFDPSFHDNCIAGLDLNHLMLQFPIIMKILQALPDSIAYRTDPSYAMFLAEKKDMALQAVRAMHSPKLSNTQYRTIFHEILNSKLPPEETAIARLGDEANVTIAAGTLTTSWTLSIALYYLLTMPEVLQKLKTELDKAIPNISSPPSLALLESLPYLGACIQESIRLGYGASGRLTVIAQDEAIVLKSSTHGSEYSIPPGTPISMTIMLLHHDERIFPSSRAFRPERWLENPRLDKYLYSFGKGTRQCVGINLAYAELALILARIFRRYGSVGVRHAGDVGVLELWETDERDVQCVADMFVPKMWKGSKGVRVKVVD